MTELSDEAVVAKVQAGDAGAFGVLIDRYEAKLTRYVSRFLQRDGAVTDVVQDTFIKAYENIQSFDASRRVSPWLYRIAHNTCLNEQRRRSRFIDGLDFDAWFAPIASSENVEADAALKADLATVEQALAALSLKSREVLVLHYFDGLSYKDIADVLKLSVGAVGVRMTRARTELARLLTNVVV